MPLDLEEARKISRLARLDLGGLEAEEQMARELGAIVQYFDQLSEYEADPPAVIARPAKTDESTHEAVDQVGRSLDRTAFEANAPDSRDGFLVVPRIKAGSAKA